MARRTVKIKFHIKNPQYFLKLCEEVAEKHTSLGTSSPLADGDIVNMSDYAALVTLARQKREEALEHYAAAEAAMEKSRALIGADHGQTVNTPGTLYYHIARIKKLLLVLHPENPEELTAWGFNVVVKEAKNRGRKKTATT